MRAPIVHKKHCHKDSAFLVNQAGRPLGGPYELRTTNHEPLTPHHFQYFPGQDGVAFGIGMDAVGVEVAASPPFGIEQGFIEVDDMTARFFAIRKEPLPILTQLVIVFFYVSGVLPTVHGTLHRSQRRDAQIYWFSLGLERRDDIPYIPADILQVPVEENVVGSAHDEEGVIPAEVELMEAIDHARRRIAALTFVVDMNQTFSRDQGRPALVRLDGKTIRQTIAQA